AHDPVPRLRRPRDGLRPGGRGAGRRGGGGGAPMTAADTNATSRIGSSQLNTLDTLRRGLQLSPELRRGLWVTVLLAGVAALGRVLVPFVVQQVTDNGILAEGGPDVGFVMTAVLAAAGVVLVTSYASYLVNLRLFRAAESGLA